MDFTGIQTLFYCSDMYIHIAQQKKPSVDRLLSLNLVVVAQESPVKYVFCSWGYFHITQDDDSVISSPY